LAFAVSNPGLCSGHDGCHGNLFPAQLADNPDALPRYSLQRIRVPFEQIDCIAVNQSELLACVHAHARAISRRFADYGGMLGAAMRVGDYALIGLLSAV